MTRLKLTYRLLLLFLLMLTLACEEVIKIDLDSVAPSLVMEAVIARDSVCIARLSHTTDYFAIGEPQAVTNAIITLSNNTGQEEILTHTGQGIYRGSMIYGESGRSYLIEIDSDDGFVSAHSFLPPVSEIVTIEAIRATYTRPGDDPSYLIDIVFSDNQATDDYYMIRFYKNDTLMKGYISLTSDFFNTSGKIKYTEWRYEFNPGDKAVVELYSIDRDLYSYFSMINEATSGGISFATPYNPKSNLQGDALGYFGSWSVISDSIMVASK